MPSTARSDAWPFLRGGGAMAELIADHAWDRTALGPLAQWPAHVRDATALMLRCQLPIVMLWGEDGVMAYNDAYAVFAGRRHPRLLGSRVREGWAEVADFNDNVMRVCLAGGTLSYQDQELTLQRNGHAEPVWMNLDYSALLDDAGRPAGVMAVVVETTRRVRAERALEDERLGLQRLFAQAPSFMAMLQGPEHRIVMANPNYLRLVGHRPVLGRTVAEALPDAVAQGYLQLLDGVWRSGESYRADGAQYSMQVQAGGPVHERYLDFVFQPIRDAGGAVSGIFMEGVDVTTRTLVMQRSEALARLTEALRVLDDAAEIGATAARIAGDTLGVAHASYVRVAAGTAGTRPWHEDGFDQAALQQGEAVVVVDVREDPRTAAAAQRFEQMQVRALMEVPIIEHGRLVALFVVHHDAPREWSSGEQSFLREIAERTRTATERVRSDAAVRRSEARLREVNESLESKVEARTRELMALEAALRQSQKTEAIGQLTGGIAHDFNNLLASMQSSLQVLEQRLAAGRTENAVRYIGMAQDAVRRAAALTQRLLAFSRRQTLDPRPLDANRLVTGMEELVRRSMGPSVQVEVQCTAGLWPTLVDAPQLESALLNLCINARDAMAPDGGRLTITTANAALDAQAAQERELPAGAYIAICVVDTGCGMSPQVMARIFDPFYTTKPLGQGTGLGLSMVYGFVRQSGGQVRVQSAPGQGTTMCLYLPRFQGELGAGGEVPAGVAAPLPSGGQVILLVEDEATVRTLIAEMLEESGYRVITAADGASALLVLQSDVRIDLLLSDVGLPGGLNGRQVADAGRVQRPGLKVLFITGYAENAAIGNGVLEPGMQVVTKPFDIEALAARVRDMVDG